MSTLLITNGDIAANLLKDAGVEATIVPWRDVLYEGPVPVTPSEAELIKIRAQHLADGTINSFDEIISGMTERNAFLDDHNSYEKIELWFEHDLHDQLELVEILAMLGSRLRLTNVILVQALNYLGMQTAETITNFKNLSLPVTAGMFERATRIWNAFRDRTPEKLFEETLEKTMGFPVLRQALERMLEELPGHDGLSRTERQILYSINRGVSRTGMLFARSNNMEEAAFLGDWSFYKILSGLQFCDSPLIDGLPEDFVPGVLQDSERRKSFITSELSLTPLGKEVLDSVQDHVQHNQIDRWIGGTHLTNTHLWRWDADNKHLIAPN